MSADALEPGQRILAARNLRVDRLTAEVAAALRAEGIEPLVLKGPALAEWLYRGEVRPYGDSDLLVAPGDWDHAAGLLARLGFHNELEPLGHPRLESAVSTAFLRGEDNVDLHRSLQGLGRPPDVVVATLMAGSRAQVIGRAGLRVPGPSALLLHVGLHAAHHMRAGPMEDLRRAIAGVDDGLWREALELAVVLDGVGAFARGLRLLPEGATLAERLGVPEAPSVRDDLRRGRVPLAEALDALLSPELRARQRIAMVAGEFFPSPAFMRWWSALARRGPLGLALAYPLRWAWLLANAPRGLLARQHARRRAQTGDR